MPIQYYPISTAMTLLVMSVTWSCTPSTWRKIMSQYGIFGKKS